jgi:hypothetical protein
MALIDKAMESDLLILFRDMDAYVMSDAEYARRFAALTDVQIRTAAVPVQAVVVDVVGDATGIQNPAEIRVV